MSELTLPLAERVALITGASRGIGRAVALRLAKAGSTTALAARTASALAAVAETIRVSGMEVLDVPTDVTDEQQLEALVDATLTRFNRIDILVNNAGGGPPRTPVVKARTKDWEWTVRL